MNIRYTVYDATKAGNQRSEMEDRAIPKQSFVAPIGEKFFCAIADGATQGSHSGPWAEALCESFTQSAGTQAWGDAINEVITKTVTNARLAFVEWEKTYIESRAINGRPIQWFEQEVIDSGAYSTLIGVQFEQILPNIGAYAEGIDPINKLAFKALAVGDSCLFLLKDQRVLLSFPLDNSDQFAGAPLLLASRRSNNELMMTALRHLEGEIGDGASMVLCTDALAAWILREKEQNLDPTEKLLQLAKGDQQNFEHFLAGLRADKKIRNDDVTFVHIELQV